MLGAIVGIFFAVMLSEFTPAWQLYLGLFFILLVRYAPAGLASLILMLVRVASFGQFGRIWKPLLAVSGAALLGLLGLVMGIEMLYHLTLDAANGSVMTRFGQAIDTKTMVPWLVVMVACAVGIAVMAPFFHGAPDNPLDRSHSAHSETGCGAGVRGTAPNSTVCTWHVG